MGLDYSKALNDGKTRTKEQAQEDGLWRLLRVLGAPPEWLGFPFLNIPGKKLSEEDALSRIVQANMAGEVEEAKNVLDYLVDRRFCTASFLRPDYSVLRRTQNNQGEVRYFVDFECSAETL